MRKLVQPTDMVLWTPATVILPSDDLRWIDDMIRVCQNAKIGVGIAAPQIGVPKRAFYLFPDFKAGKVIANPEILEKSEEMDEGGEGCLSFPGVHVKVKRHRWITIRYQEIVSGKHSDYLNDPIVATFADFLAKIVQHEIDHLNGVCLVGEEWKRQRAASVQRVNLLAKTWST